ncbi:MAG: enoyl-CoA hydratase-related protein [Chloroflexota bacterium]|nr:enoyl-CoA hydratase-related protein [Chloroflexota bacterium]
MPTDFIDFTRKDTLGLITLNRPEARNALTPAMVADLGRIIGDCARPEIRAVMLTGTGGAFCAGADVKDFADSLESGGPEALSTHVQELADALHRDVIMGIRRLQKPVIAAVNGVAAGAGFSLALCCDVRVASADARFIMAYAGIGCTADGGSTYMLPRLVGVSKAMEIYMASQPIGAEYARELGLVNQVCPADTFDRHALEMATRLAQGPTLAYGRVKSLYENGWGASLEEQLDAETDAISKIVFTGDFQEGVKAFTQKRLPWFQGR